MTKFIKIDRFLVSGLGFRILWNLSICHSNMISISALLVLANFTAIFDTSSTSTFGSLVGLTPNVYNPSAVWSCQIVTTDTKAPVTLSSSSPSSKSFKKINRRLLFCVRTHRSGRRSSYQSMLMPHSRCQQTNTQRPLMIQSLFQDQRMVQSHLKQY